MAYARIRRMADTFQLKSPGPTPGELAQAEDLITRITSLSFERRRKRPKLEAWSFRIPIKLHSDLGELSRELDPVAMSDIINGLLEIYLPLMLAVRRGAGKPAAGQDQMTTLLSQLMDLVKTQGAKV